MRQFVTNMTIMSSNRKMPMRTSLVFSCGITNVCVCVYLCVSKKPVNISDVSCVLHLSERHESILRRIPLLRSPDLNLDARASCTPSGFSLCVQLSWA